MDTPYSSPAPGNPATQLPPPTNGLAITSMILGILGVFFTCLTGIPAIICGHIAKKQIKKSNGSQKGAGFATTGLVTGYIFSALSVFVIAGLTVPVAMKALSKAEMVTSLNNARMVHKQIADYSLDNGAYPARLQDLFPDKSSMDALVLTPVGRSTKDRAPLEYVPGLSDSSPPTQVILYGPAAFQGEVIVGRVNGDFQIVPEAEFAAEAAAQGLPFPTVTP